jgi:plasmid replication initiation protein
MLLATTAYLPNQVLNAGYNYTPHETDALLLIINAFQGETILTMKLNAFLTNYGTSNNNLAEFNKTMRGILSKPLEFYNKETRTYFTENFILRYTHNTRTNEITVLFSPEMCAILTRTKEKYSLYSLRVLLALDSRYSKRIYLFCNAWKSSGLFSIDVEKLRSKLQIGNKYEQTADFKRKILEPAFAEINEKSELFIEPVYIKQGREIITLQCNVSVKTELTSGNTKEREQLRKFGVASWIIDNALATLTTSEINDAINNVIMNQHQIKNTSSYIYGTFKKLGVPLEKKLF